MNNEIVESLKPLLFELDKLKETERCTYILGGVRLENSAEHSWQLALMSWLLAEAAGLNLNHEKLLKLALVHDLGEIDGGDTFLYAEERSDAANHELDCVERLEQDHSLLLNNLTRIWKDQEYGDSDESRFLKVMDRLLPFLHNINSEGKSWRENGIRKEQVMAKHAFVADEIPALHQWMMQLLDEAEAKGWFTAA